jgi:hypothetical protein
MPPIRVTDTRSNRPETVANVANAIGRSALKKRLVQAVYRGKKKVKTLPDLIKATGLSHKRVLDLGGALDADGVFHKIIGVDNRIAYEKDAFVARHKQQILSAAGKPDKIAKIHTKSNPRVSVVVTAKVAPARARVRTITIDEIDSFAKVKKLPRGRGYVVMPEAQFKKGIQAIVGEPYDQPDWGGEKGDLHTTRVRIKGRRVPTVFAFKGPGTKGPLTPGKMGKRGDQIANLFEADADVYLVQFWRNTDPALLKHMRVFAEFHAGARASGTLRYGVIDGEDSARIIAAYPKAFGRVRKPGRPKRQRP